MAFNTLHRLIVGHGTSLYNRISPFLLANRSSNNWKISNNKAHSIIGCLCYCWLALGHESLESFPLLKNFSKISQNVTPKTVKIWLIHKNFLASGNFLKNFLKFSQNFLTFRKFLKNFLKPSQNFSKVFCNFLTSQKFLKIFPKVSYFSKTSQKFDSFIKSENDQNALQRPSLCLAALLCKSDCNTLIEKSLDFQFPATDTNTFSTLHCQPGFSYYQVLRKTPTGRCCKVCCCSKILCITAPRLCPILFSSNAGFYVVFILAISSVGGNLVEQINIIPKLLLTGNM